MFQQGFAAGTNGELQGLPTDHGFEPALADLRLERINQNNPITVQHIEVTGSTSPTFTMSHRSDYHIKLEKLRQHARTGDDKLFVLVYDRYRDASGHVGPKLVIFAIPAGAVEPGGALHGVKTVMSRGQLMACIPPGSRFEITPQQFASRVHTALNKANYDMLTPGQQAKDRAWHSALQADTPRLARLNQDYVARRSEITIPGGKVAALSGLQKIALRRLGCLNDAAVVSEYRQAAGVPDQRAASRGLGR